VAGSLLLFSSGLASACSGVTIAGICFHVTTIALPGYNAELTRANDSGTTIGDYSTLNQFLAPGFGYYQAKGGPVEQLREPNSLPASAVDPYTLTQAIGLNDSNEVAGYYNDTSAALHGFTLTGGPSGTWATVDYWHATTGATGTVLRGVNNAGDVVGTTIAMPGGDVGFIVVAGTATSIGAGLSPQSVNDFREIVGLNGTTGFYRSPSGTVSAVTFPGSTSTLASCINDLEMIGGTYGNSAGNHGFVYDRLFNQYFSFDIPGSTSTNVRTITNALEIYGNYIAGGVAHGYALTPALSWSCSQEELS
jgi:hypothetical protein